MSDVPIIHTRDASLTLPLENNGFLTNNFPKLPKAHTRALGFSGTRGAGADGKSSGVGTRCWGADNNLDKLRGMNRAYLQGLQPHSKQSAEGGRSQPLYKENGVENGETQNPDDLNHPEAAETFKDCIGGKSSNGGDGEQQTLATLEEPFSAGCQDYHGTSFHSAVSRASSKVFSRVKTPNPYDVGRQSGDGPMLGDFGGTAAFEEDTAISMPPAETRTTTMGKVDAQWVAPKDIDFEKGRKAMEEFWKKRREESESGWDTEWTGLLG